VAGRIVICFGINPVYANYAVSEEVLQFALRKLTSNGEPSVTQLCEYIETLIEFYVMTKRWE